MKSGDELKPIRKKITRQLLRLYAEASSDKNPIHLDEEFAKKMGLGGVIAHGMLSMAFMADQIFYHSPQTRLLKLRARFRRVARPGDELTCGGTVARMSPAGGWVLTLWIKNQLGELTSDGEAHIGLS